MFVEDLQVRLCSPDFQSDWGVVGNPIYVTLTRLRTSPGLLEIQIPGDSPTREYLLREMCGLEVRLRGRVEFLGHVYQRRGSITGDGPVTVYAREETEIFDHTLAVPVPWVVPAADGELSWASNGTIEPAALHDSAQAFPRDHESAGHYAWSYPFVSMPGYPAQVGEFLAPMLRANLSRAGYTRGTVRSGGYAASSLVNTGAGAPYTIVSNASWASGVTLTPPPWIAGFDGILPRFQTLREVVEPFMKWADEHTERSFNLFVDGEIGQPISVGIRQAPITYPTVLSERAGTVLDGDWSMTDHVGSRIILGGPGEMHKRLFVERRNAAREKAGRVVERFREATAAKLRYSGADEPPAADGTYAKWPRRFFLEARPTAREKAAVRSYFAQAGGKELSDTAATHTLSAALQESEGVFYGGMTGYQLGQKVLVDVGADLPQSGRIEKVTISLAQGSGLTVTPEIGEGIAGSDAQIARAVRAIATKTRRDASDK